MLDKPHDQLEQVGLSLAEAKELLGRVQERVVGAQATAFLADHRRGGACGKRLWSKGRFAALQLGTDPDAIGDYAERRQTVSEHQQPIGAYLSLRPFDASAAEDLARFLEGEAQRLAGMCASCFTHGAHGAADDWLYL